MSQDTNPKFDVISKFDSPVTAYHIQGIRVRKDAGPTREIHVTVVTKNLSDHVADLISLLRLLVEDQIKIPVTGLTGYPVVLPVNKEYQDISNYILTNPESIHGWSGTYTFTLETSYSGEAFPVNEENLVNIIKSWHGQQSVAVGTRP